MTLVEFSEGETAIRALHALRALFLISLLVFLAKLLSVARSSTKRAKPAHPALNRFAALLGLAFCGLLVYQASWQLAGFMRPDFVAFMKRYNPRPANPAGQQARGRILDRNGIELAADRPGRPGTRWYPQGSAAAHLVGYAHDVYGKSGIEAADDTHLSGGGVTALKDLETFGRNVIDHASVRGNDLALTLDARLQNRAARLLNGRRGAVVMLQTFDGAVLVLAGSPAFDPNALDPAGLEHDPAAPMFNRALHGRYPPGSTFKTLTAAAALEHQVDLVLDCPASGYQAPGANRSIRDHEYYQARRENRRWEGQGRLTMEQAFSRSSNVYFAQAGVRLGRDHMHRMARRFFLDRRLTVFTGSSGALSSKACLLPRPEATSQAELAQMAIGQGKLALTPLHVALIASAIAEKGQVRQPHLRREGAGRLLGRATTARTARKVGLLMRRSVTHGTSRGARIRGIEVAGKTGTAQNPGCKDHAWFMCFAPFRRPAVALAVVVEAGGYGSETAVPLAVDLLQHAKALGLLERKADSAQKRGTRDE